jgi:hypothetical protein
MGFQVADLVKMFQETKAKAKLAGQLLACSLASGYPFIK